jgi:hypothetical protein
VFGDLKVRQFWNLANDCFKWQRDCCDGPGPRSGAVTRTARGIELMPCALMIEACEASLPLGTGGDAEG